jgi:hypothetical protein
MKKNNPLNTPQKKQKKPTPQQIVEMKEEAYRLAREVANSRAEDTEAAGNRLFAHLDMMVEIFTVTAKIFKDSE